MSRSDIKKFITHTIEKYSTLPLNIKKELNSTTEPLLDKIDKLIPKVSFFKENISQTNECKLSQAHCMHRLG